jgi:drug/metabolite transporter (DMT)-like permease
MCLWGLGWPSNKYLTHFCSPVTLIVYRYIIVISTLLPVLLIARMRISIKTKGIPVILISGAMLAVYSFFFFQGLSLGASGAGGVLVTTLNPIAAYVIGIALSRKLPSRNESIGLLLGAIAGCVLLRVWDKPEHILNSGNIFFLAAALTWAIMSKFTARGHHYGTSMGFSLWQYLVTMICILPSVKASEMAAFLQIRDTLFWLNLIFGSVVVTTLATTMYFYTTTRLGAEKASSFIFLVPFAAAFSSWAFLGERILPNTIIGGILGMAAVYLINKKKPKVVVEPE